MSNAEIAGDKIDRDKFEPMRHINLPDNLHRGFFTPCGLGPRMCPATKIAGLIFKKFIAGMALNLDEFSVENIKFRSQQNLSLPIARQKYRKK
jgi:hypothetical protein